MSSIEVSDCRACSKPIHCTLLLIKFAFLASLFMITLTLAVSYLLVTPSMHVPPYVELSYLRIIVVCVCVAH